MLTYQFATSIGKMSARLVQVKKMLINIVRLNSLAIAPRYMYDDDAGADLFSIDTVIILPGDTHMFRTGLSIEIPKGYEGQIRSRSGLATKWHVAVINSPGTIDSGYTGEIKIPLINHGNECYVVQIGDRIAQLVIAPVIRADFQEKSEIDRNSERGDSGFGGSGV